MKPILTLLALAALTACAPMTTQQLLLAQSDAEQAAYSKCGSGFKITDLRTAVCADGRKVVL